MNADIPKCLASRTRSSRSKEYHDNQIKKNSMYYMDDDMTNNAIARCNASESETPYSVYLESLPKFTNDFDVATVTDDTCSTTISTVASRNGNTYNAIARCNASESATPYSVYLESLPPLPPMDCVSFAPLGGMPPDKYKDFMLASIQDLLIEYDRLVLTYEHTSENFKRMRTIRQIVERWEEFTILPKDLSKVTLTRGSNAVVNMEIPLSDTLRRLNEDADVDSTDSSMPELIPYEEYTKKQFTESDYDTDDDEERLCLYNLESYLESIGI